MPQLSQACKRRMVTALAVLQQNNVYQKVTKHEEFDLNEAIVINNELTPSVMLTDFPVNTFEKKQRRLLDYTLKIEKLVTKYVNMRYR